MKPKEIFQKVKGAVTSPEAKVFIQETAKQVIAIGVVTLANVGIHVVAEVIKGAVAGKTNSEVKS